MTLALKLERIEMKPEKAAEKVLCVPRHILLKEPFEGYRDATSAPGATTSSRYQWLNELVERHGVFVARGECETDPSLLQIIPYPIIRDMSRVFHITRGSKQGEERLHNQVSIGHGGHINECDNHIALTNNKRHCLIPAGLMYSALIRELDEEIIIDGDYNIDFKGEINLECNDVNIVHYGVVFVVELWEGSTVKVGEPDKVSDSGWSVPSELTDLNLELWSSVAAEGIYGIEQTRRQSDETTE